MGRFLGPPSEGRSDGSGFLKFELTLQSFDDKPYFFIHSTHANGSCALDFDIFFMVEKFSAWTCALKCSKKFAEGEKITFSSFVRGPRVAAPTFIGGTAVAAASPQLVVLPC